MKLQRHPRRTSEITISGQFIEQPFKEFSHTLRMCPEKSGRAIVKLAKNQPTTEGSTSIWNKSGEMPETHLSLLLQGYKMPLYKDVSA
ncbi:hypothetical protein V6N11_033707 [Hibiscus sabdariffa]|uniref:Uncharacterized protein n=1 Tax=Hibiscus sabdariffa TaxID=183260 RepID=A0ABR2S068_9ROSI